MQGVAPRDVFPSEGHLLSADEEVRQLSRELEIVKQERGLPTSVGVLRPRVTVSDKYIVAAVHRATFDVTMMCRVLQVSRAGFYAAQ